MGGPDAARPQPPREANGTLIGSELFVYGGRDADRSHGHRPARRRRHGDRLGLARPGRDRRAEPHPRPALGHGHRPASNLPAPRTKAAGFTSNGVIYLVGGSDGTSPKDEVYWTTPDSSGNITGWQHLSQTDLPATSGGLAGSAGIASGSEAFVVGGTTSTPGSPPAPGRASHPSRRSSPWA